MRRRMASLLNVISLLLCVLMLLLWLRSYHRSDTLKWTGRVLNWKDVSKLRIVMIYSGQGCLELAVAQDPYWSARDAVIADPWQYVAQNYPEHPANAQIEFGYKRTWHNFGAITGGDEGTRTTTIVSMSIDSYRNVAFGPGRVLGSVEHFQALSLPHWIFVLLFGLLPARKILRWIRQYRHG